MSLKLGWKSKIMVISLLAYSLQYKVAYCISQDQLMKYVRFDMSKVPCEIIIDDEALYRDYGDRSTEPKELGQL